MKDKTLVIVESPAKAKTISQFLGNDYRVEASFGHVRDLPNSAAEIPEDIKKAKWSRLGVNVEQGFEPVYVVPADKKKHVARLRSALREARALLLATDEDREGESISWHLLQVLEPKRTTQVERIVFHEITREAIRSAIARPRQVDEALVRAQESRRILDRLYGYTLSPLLWKKVAPGLSAGRVQSVATRLIVDRERERKTFRTSDYWDLLAEVKAASGKFKATLVRIGAGRLATGKSFDASTGVLKERKHVLLDEQAARLLEKQALVARPWVVSRLEQTPGVERPVPPFTTSTLQQEANRKLRYASKRTMQLAQQLYEGVDLQGERVGLITYMRTDSLTLSERAIADARAVISDLYGPSYLPPGPIRYKTSSRNAQEAHEAIRPTDLSRRPQDVRAWLDDDQFRLYEMIWKRTIACQMVPAQIRRTNLEITVENLTFYTSGKQILFPGFLRAYVEGSDDPDAEIADKETLLPLVSVGDQVQPLTVTAQGHSTRPPARYTEASLVKKLEEEGIGRPSTYASIISTIHDRGYIFRRNQELVPTFTAFCVTEFLETHFKDLVDVGFTSVMEDQLDEIATGKRDSQAYLKDFYDGRNEEPGLVTRVAQEASRLEFPRIRIGEDPEGRGAIVVKLGRFGPYLQRGEGGEGHFAPVPEELAPAELSLETALELLAARSAGPAVVGQHPVSGTNITLQKGRFGEYLQVELTPEQAAREEKPRRVSIPTELKGHPLSPEDVALLVSLPRELGRHPETGAELSTGIGRFGPYLKCGDQYRNLPDWRTACLISPEQALAVLSQPRQPRGRRAAVVTVLRELGMLEGAAGNVRILDGRYGPYLTDGKTNATLPRGRTVEDLTAQEAVDLLVAKAASKPSGKGRGRKAKVEVAPKKTARGKKAAGETAEVVAPKKPARGKKAAVETAEVVAPKKPARGKKATGETAEVVAPKKPARGKKAAVETAEVVAPKKPARGKKAAGETAEVVAPKKPARGKKAAVETAEAPEPKKPPRGNKK